MSVTLHIPTREDERKFGPLAWVTAEKRAKILALPFGEFKPAIKQLKKDIAAFKKRPSNPMFNGQWDNEA